MRNRVVYYRVRPVLRVLSVAFPCFTLGLVGSPAFAQASVQGQWVPPPDGKGGFDYPWALGARHAAVLSTGKVLVWEFAGSTAKLWNPLNGVFTDVPSIAPACELSLHCPGHAFLMDGSLLLPGGLGTTETRIFRLTGPGGWEVVNPMAHGRFYPTCTTLPDGRVLTVAGKGSGTEIPEIYDPGTGMWYELTDPEAKTVGIAEEYPFMFLLPDGRSSMPGDQMPSLPHQSKPTRSISRVLLRPGLSFPN